MIGRTLGQYQIQEQLGSGGMGVVYKAHDTKLDRTVALKFLPPTLSSDESAKARFIQEARAASALDHANICTIHDVGEDDEGQLFIVMSFYDGQTLKYLLQNGALEPNEAVRIAHQISRGLARAHEAGIVHRDVKPANIMVTSRGDVKILDFGVAKLNESLDLTKAGSTVGTAAYMSPEQARGETVDRRADIWSIGVLLYEMLAGEAPFGGGYEAALVYAIINEDPAPMPDSIDTGLAAVAARCVAKSASERYDTADELASDLEEFLSPSGARVVATSSSGIAAAALETIPGTGKLIAMFFPVAAIVLTLVWAGMMEFGLPDWVFTGGVVLMALGLPVLLWSAALDRQRADGVEIQGLSGAFTLRKAIWGGVLSMSALSLLSATFMVMRVWGIGPAATLVSSGELVENAKLIVAEFKNNTPDETLGASVTELLRIDLSQSTAVKVMDGADIVAVLSLMNRPTDAKIDIDTAMEIANRAGAEAVVAGEISPIGSGFVISLRLLAADDGAIIEAIDRLSGKLREQIGESIKSIRDNEELDRVTTSSLDALRLYSQGVAETDRGNFSRSIELLQQAIEHDSTFAMAYRKLAVTYNNAEISFQLQVAAATKAFELRERMPERERGLAEAYYYGRVLGDIDRTVAAYENVLSSYPDENAALNNVSIYYNTRGEFSKAERNTLHAIELGDRNTFYYHLLVAYLGQKKFEDAQALLEQADERLPDHPFRANGRFLLAMARHDFEAADTMINAASVLNNTFWRMTDAANRAALETARGNISSADRSSEIVRELNATRGSRTAALDAAISKANRYLDLMGDSERALSVINKALEETPLRTLEPEEAPYPALIFSLAKAGAADQAELFLTQYERDVHPGIRQGDFMSFVARAEVKIAKGDLSGSLAILDEYEKHFRCEWCADRQRAQIMERVDSLEAAARYYQADLDNTIGYGMEARSGWRAPTFLRLGEIHSRLGNIGAALEAYQNFVDIWVDADEILQPQVQYARDRIDQLLRQSVREPQ